jgi:hypothetical protein
MKSYYMISLIVWRLELAYHEKPDFVMDVVEYIIISNFIMVLS